MSESAAARLGLGTLASVVDAAPDGVAIFDGDWTIRYVNPAGAELLQRSPSELVDRNIWIALPELGGTIFHSFLLHARSVDSSVAWQGYYAPADRWLSATAARDGDLLRLHFRPRTAHLTELPVDPAGNGDHLESDDDVDRDRLRFLAEVSEALISTLDTGETAAQLAELVVPRLCDWAFVAMLGDDGRPTGEEARAHRDPACHADLDAYLTGRVRGTGDDSPLMAALLTGEPVQLPTIDPELIDPSLGTEQVREAWRRLDTTSCTIVPLRARTGTIGALALMNTGDRPPHTEMLIATAVEVARRASLALDNARLYERQLKVAETLQHSLLTPPPQPEDLQIAVRYQPAASHMHVGGDWYDASGQPDGAILLVIGDVVGHNVDAAAAMGQIRSILRGIAYDRPEGPAGILARVDDVLTGLHVGTLATALVARLELPSDQAGAGQRILRWSSAGHLPPVLLRADGRVQLLRSTPERLLGSGTVSPRNDHEAVLDCDDTVLFYTDGIVEHGRSDIDQGIERLVHVLRQVHHLPLEELCDEVLTRIVPGRTDDDIALLAVRNRPQVRQSPAT
ncbi:PP2C family protein-serine/threonine phosphatase [Blastococcus saxobsidens]|uniref:Serine phosphatase RsbU, regulator of sigma subunit n=1 Tax=Blastococcus saxobsidens (strain DD2) TaxID=1146883 RepID=H6RN83_BLASD|nr:SpoIIE family protein phosphatase [Blastococcus saxobsidens]CCG02631.1 Serine phosphatase RsbU, regulator of sigma subunit [Blastococcus saxobsidens DD2]